MPEAPRKSPRVQLLLIVAVFFGPLLIAAWMYYGGHFIDAEQRSNHGALLQPIVNLGEAFPESRLHAHNENLWLLLYADSHDCGDACRQALYTVRQARLMLGKEMDRLARVFLHGDRAPDTLFVADEHRGLITLHDASLAGLLENKKPAELPTGGYFLIDPLGNLVMYFRPDIDPSDMVDDIKHLLKLSRIG